MRSRRRRKPFPGSGKSVLTALVLIPPESVWPPIQAIRARYDRRFTRWMPHITLLFPFVPKEQIAPLLPRFESALATVVPFTVRLAEFRYFWHPTGTATIWLAPEPPEPIDHLQRLLQEVVPWCDDQRRHPEGFTPHLSVGQVRSWDEAEQLAATLQAAWQPIEFDADHVSIVVREQTTPFREAFRVRFGGARDEGPVTDGSEAQMP